MAEKAHIRRCAIYVRKSSEEGLDMSYNSLEAQRDACSAYIASQRHEGWMRLPTIYEDGGYSGGNMDRPGVQQLLGDVAAGKIDIIVVYKIDRLTRSLTDFAKLNDLLDRHQVSFVAVTQQFNTSTSMGRLTLNVLLSFAQFEREVAGERIRDKVAASKKKGLWMGGPVPLGYAVKDRKLVIVREEAEIVQNMFARYLELKSVHLLQRELEAQGVRSRQRILTDGRSAGGHVLGRGAISHMLQNPLYLGLISHAGELHTGQHEAIVDRESFDHVQATLADAGPGDNATSKRASSALLKGLLYDVNGNRLQPTHCNKKGVRYHYYTSARRLRSASDDPQGVRVPAGDLERVVITAIADRLKDETLMHLWLSNHVQASDLPALLTRCSALAKCISSSDHAGAIAARTIIDRVQVSKNLIDIRLSEVRLRRELQILPLQSAIDSERQPTRRPPSGLKGESSSSTPGQLHIAVASHLLRCGKQVKLVLSNGVDESGKVNPLLVDMIVKPWRWHRGLTSGRYPTLRSIASEERCDKSHVSRLLTIAFLAPDIVERILEGRHRATLTPERLRKACPLPMRWDEQRALLLD